MPPKLFCSALLLTTPELLKERKKLPRKGRWAFIGCLVGERLDRFYAWRTHLISWMLVVVVVVSDSGGSSTSPKAQNPLKRLPTFQALNYIRKLESAYQLLQVFLQIVPRKTYYDSFHVPCILAWLWCWDFWLLGWDLWRTLQKCRAIRQRGCAPMYMYIQAWWL